MNAIEETIFSWREPPRITPADIEGVFNPASYFAGPDPEYEPVLHGLYLNLASRKFERVNTSFKSNLKRLTLPSLDLDYALAEPPQPQAKSNRDDPLPSLDLDYALAEPPQPQAKSNRDDPLERLYYWLYIVDEWASQAAFVPGGLGDWTFGLSTQVFILERVGVAAVFAVSDLRFSDELFHSKREWRYQKGPFVEAYPVGTAKSCPCIFIQVPDGALDWDELRALGETQWAEVGCPVGSMQHMLHLVVNFCHEYLCPRTIISDGKMSFFMEVERTAFEEALSSAIVFGELIPASTYPVIYLLLAALSAVSYSLADPEPQTLGALGDTVPQVCEDFQRFRDFDVYHLGQNSSYYAAFLRWKDRARARAVQNMPSRGSILAVHRTEPIPRKLTAWFCFEQYEPVPLPDSVSSSVCSRKRPRNPIVEELLKFNPVPLPFEITDVLVQGAGSHGEGMWSQVYVGRLHGTDGLLCLKVFDERCFPVPDLEVFQHHAVPHKFVLAGILLADNMVRREHAGYARLSKYQGQLIPHFYGCIEVELPGGYIAFGILMEYVAGVPLSRIIDTVRSDWTHEEQVKLFRRLRNAVKVLNASRVSQKDWHASQILCVERDDPDQHLDRSDALDLVLLDLASTDQPWGRCHVLPETKDVLRVPLRLQLSDEIIAEAGWLPEERDVFEL
ncbi:hypothetical protein AURDEDRAFT_183844 [Auricularia subglabra TFB-10046 SS5]|nr:hypothetical protein AURDEDRAFT_183844 [Auricularia subglabra TFB-10046 SS5]